MLLQGKQMQSPITVVDLEQLCMWLGFWTLHGCADICCSHRKHYRHAVHATGMALQNSVTDRAI
jgi:hypothetical protein